MDHWAPEYVIAFEKYEDLLRFAEQERLAQASLKGRSMIAKVADWVEDGGIKGAVCTIKPLKDTKLCLDETPA
jgi:hypothetical protein